MSAPRRAVYFDCYSGVSGDMVLGALLDAGLEEEALRSRLRGLAVRGYDLSVQRVRRSGFAGTHVRVVLADEPPVERRLSDIELIITSSDLPPFVQERSIAVFRRLAAVEARVHGIEVEQVHFHEVGAVDAIVDVVGASIGLALLEADAIYASSLPLGSGMIKSAHGMLPLPAPATLALIADAGAPTRPLDIQAELVTPTGAALLTTLATFRQPPMTINHIGVGFGTRELPWPNALRVWVGNEVESGLETGEVTVIETNLDDSTPEQVGYALERLLEAGALDAFLAPVQMKKNRPGVVLTVLAPAARADALARLVLRETSSLGVRFRASQRLMAPRRPATLQTRFGPLQVKIKSLDGRDIVAPEYEECARVARERGVPLAEVYRAVAAAAEQGESGPA